MREHPMIEPQRLDGCEPIIDEEGTVVSSVGDFWSWAYSNVIDNAERGALAEYIVAKGLGVADNVRINWDKYDLLTKEGISVEVKSSGYIQSWEQKGFSSPGFGIQPTHGWDSITNTYSEEAYRQAQVYVFCLHSYKDQEIVNPLDIAQWEFYILPTEVLNEELKEQKRVSLSTLIRIGAQKCRFEEIYDVVKQCAAYNSEKRRIIGV